jgi:hypothetical protein
MMLKDEIDEILDGRFLIKALRGEYAKPWGHQAVAEIWSVPLAGGSRDKAATPQASMLEIFYTIHTKRSFKRDPNG